MSEVDTENRADAQVQPEVPSSGRSSANTAVMAAGWLCLIAALTLLVLFLLRPGAPTPANIDVQWTASADAAVGMAAPSLIPDRPSAGGFVPEEVDGTQQLIAESRAAVAGSDAGFWDDEVWTRLSQRGNEDTGRKGLDEARRWRFFFDEGLTESEYARQLEALGIEIGLIGGPQTDQPQIKYITKLVEQIPQTRTGPASAESRLYLSWNQGNLNEADRSLLGRAGLDATGQVVVHFCSPELEQKLLDLEREFMNRQAAEIEYTQFGVRAAGTSFEFYVRQQK